jgi:hypothetical protein
MKEFSKLRKILSGARTPEPLRYTLMEQILRIFSMQCVLIIQEYYVALLFTKKETV